MTSTSQDKIPSDLCALSPSVIALEQEAQVIPEMANWEVTSGAPVPTNSMPVETATVFSVFSDRNFVILILGISDFFSFCAARCSA